MTFYTVTHNGETKKFSTKSGRDMQIWGILARDNETGLSKEVYTPWQLTHAVLNLIGHESGEPVPEASARIIDRFLGKVTPDLANGIRVSVVGGHLKAYPVGTTAWIHYLSDLGIEIGEVEG